MRRNLISDLGLSPAQAERLLDAMNRCFPDALVSRYDAIVDVMRNHPKDRHVAAAAVTCHAHVIVTANLRDFPRSALAPFGIEAQLPDEFLTDLLGVDPAAMERIIREQAGALVNPPMTVSRLLEALARHAPVFASPVRQRLGL